MYLQICGVWKLYPYLQVCEVLKLYHNSQGPILGAKKCVRHIFANFDPNFEAKYVCNSFVIMFIIQSMSICISR